MQRSESVVGWLWKRPTGYSFACT